MLSINSTLDRLTISLTWSCMYIMYGLILWVEIQVELYYYLKEQFVFLNSYFKAHTEPFKTQTFTVSRTIKLFYDMPNWDEIIKQMSYKRHKL